MYGFHPYETALAIARDRTKSTGVQHTVLPAEAADGAPGLYTIGVQLKVTTVDELIGKIKGDE